MSPAPERRLRQTAGALSLLAAAVHGGLTSEHFAAWWGYGAFFAVAAAAQALLGLALILDALPDDASRRWIAVGGLVGQLLLVALYVVTRTVGIPLAGPDAGLVETVAPIDVLTEAMQLACAGLLAALLVRASARRRQPIDAAPR